MNDTILAAIITFFGTVSAPLIAFLVQGNLKSSKIDSFKKGYNFKGEWADDSSGRVITDEITVNSTWFGKIKCTGRLTHNGTVKEYKLIGKQYAYCITFEYLGINNGQHDQTAGVVIINKTNPNTMQMTGKWSQLNLDGILIGGDVLINRIV